jgi:nucleoside-diphosphate-sugar epimerase
MRAVVTGVTGYIGGRLARALGQSGVEVHAVVRPSSNLASLPEIRGTHVHDGTTAGLVRILESARPDVVFHTAALVLSDHRTEQVAPVVESNVLFGAQLLEAMACAGVTDLVNTGTAWQHYHSDHYNPVNLYAATKEAFEALIAFYAGSGRIRAATLRLFDVYGPDDPRPKLLSLLDRASRDGTELGLTPGEQQIDLVHVDDVVAAYLAAARLLRGGIDGHRVYAVSTGEPVSVRTLVELFERASGRALRVTWGARPYREREIMRPWAGGVRVPGWSVSIPLEAGLRRVYGDAVPAGTP